MSSNIKVTRVCQFCGESFTARTTVTKYCSHGCASKAYKQRHRNKKVEISTAETVKEISAEVVELQAKEFLSITEVGQLLNVSRWTVSRAIKARRLNAVKFGRKLIVRRSDIDRLFGEKL